MLSKQPHALNIAIKLCESVGSPYAKRASFSLSNRIFGIPMPNPDAYANARDFALDYACYTYVRKYSDGPYSARDLEAKALIGFKETESELLKYNLNFNQVLTSGKPGVACCMFAAQRKVRSILGKFKPTEWAEHCEWGPGATSSLRAESATVDKKILERKVSVTNRALPFYKWFLENDIHMFFSRTGIMPEGPYSVLLTEFSVVDSSRLTTVEKKYDERRIIDIQPTANLFLQKGIGQMIRRRLRNVGIDLDDQSRNQWLASVAHRLQLCTIDLAKASDTVSFSLIRFLLPDDWFFALDALRTRFTEYKGEKLYLNKFSAMGNGYTFELESLVFYALICAVYEFQGLSEKHIGVYGDDLIVDRAAVRNVLVILTEAGFKVNSEKSFTRGRFYESCGKHYFDGRDVTPLYQKEPIKDFPSAVRACNRVFRYALRLGNGEYLEATIKPVWQLCRSICEAFWASWMDQRKKKGRKTYGIPRLPFYSTEDTGILDDFVPSIRGGLYRFKKLVFEPVKTPADNAALYALSLRRKCVVESPFLGVVTLRGRLKSVSLGELKLTVETRPY